jgi:hypothetical protein
MTTIFKRILPEIIREGNSGSGGTTVYANYAAVYAVKNSVVENPHYFSIDYDLPYFGIGSCKGMILNGRINLFDFLPIVLFDTTFTATTSLTNTGVSLSIDANGLPTFTKTSGNSAATTNVFIEGSTIIDFGQTVEYEVFHQDTSASGDRLFGIGVSASDVSPISGVSGDLIAPTIYRFSNNWSLYQTSLTTGSYAGFGQVSQNNSVANNKYNPGKVVRLRVEMVNPFSVASNSRIAFFEDAEAEVFSTNIPAPSNLSPSDTKTIKIGIYMYSYPNQQSVTKLLRIRVRDIPQNFTQPSYPAAP